MARLDVAQIVEQQRVEYLDPKGIRRHHVFDLLVTRTDGTRIATAVKPSVKALQRQWLDPDAKAAGCPPDFPNLEAMLKFIAKSIPRRFANAVALMTEKHCKKHAVFNAEAKLASLHAPIAQKHVSAVREAVACLTGTMTIGALAAACDDAGQGFWAVVRLVAEGVLEPVGQCKLTTGAVVRAVSPRLWLH